MQDSLDDSKVSSSYCNMISAAPDIMILHDKELESSHVEDCGTDGKSASVEDLTTGHKSPAEARLVRKVDMVMMPMLWLMYWLNYLDRNAITVARLDKMEKELKITSIQYQTCVSILFVGYILGQVPASKLRVSCESVHLTCVKI